MDSIGAPALSVFLPSVWQGESERAQSAVFLQPLGPLMALPGHITAELYDAIFMGPDTLWRQHFACIMFSGFQDTNNCVHSAQHKQMHTNQSVFTSAA